MKWLFIVSALTVSVLALHLVRLAMERQPLGRSEGNMVTTGIMARWIIVAPMIQCARAIGFVKGVLNRPMAFSRRFTNVTGVTFILSGVPISDSGGGQRATQLALELLHRNNLVVFINKFPRHESVDLNIQIMEPNLLTYSVDCFDLQTFMESYRLVLRNKDVSAIVEFPLPDFVPLVNGIRAIGGTIIYDLIDDWTTSLGSSWYSVKTEQAIIKASDILIATSQPLREQLEQLSGRPVTLVPNAVNLNIFSRSTNYERPPDLVPGEFVICYIGALWGEWFNWDLLRKIALAYPKASVIVIGDYRGQCAQPPPNLHFLGLKAQTELPAYLAHSDVTIIPWTVSQLTHATNPLKVYEYLAMGKPVVAPPIKALEGIPYVFLSDSDREFITNIDKARRTKVDVVVIESFIQRNSWAQRVSLLADLVRQSGKRMNNSSEV
jgi:glycosyltransferase involved in cell wall biosynthesis